MSEAGDYTPASYWAGHDFNDARKRYNKHVDRSYDDATIDGKVAGDLVPTKLVTESTAPVVIAIDVTGSMGDWPATIFSKLPYMDHELRTEYLGENAEISFMAVGDVYSDKYPLQVQQFAKEGKLKENLESLVIEGNGGGQSSESYDLAAAYCARNVEMPNAIKPILIYIGDEGLYDHVDRGSAKDIGHVDIEGRLSTAAIFQELQQKYSVYLVKKPYGHGSGDGLSSDESRIRKQWASLIGEDHISILPDPNRVVDVIFGILAKETGKIDYFHDELVDRQKPGQVKTVLKALETIHKLDGPNSHPLLEDGRSRIKRTGSAKKTKGLL